MTGCQPDVSMFCDIQGSWMPSEESMMQMCFMPAQLSCDAQRMYCCPQFQMPSTRLRYLVAEAAPLCGLDDSTQK